MPTKIEWTHLSGTTGETWNPVTGCTKISPGCTHCYAERMARRLAGRYGYPEAPHHFDVTLYPERLEQPLRWRKPRTVFVCSMGDLFHEGTPPDYIYKVFGVMALSPQHSFQVLTKRPQRMFDILSHYARAEVHRANLLGHDPMNVSMWPLPNVWLGVTAENQAAADERIPLLLQTPAAVRFVSCEPLLSEIDITPFLPRQEWRAVGSGPNVVGADIEYIEGIDWLIVGGESGPGVRPMHPDWARSLRDQAQAAGVPFFFKQWGQFVPECHWKQLTMEQRNRKGAVYSFDDKRFPQNQRMYSVGKKAAGRLLDGREHNGFPY